MVAAVGRPGRLLGAAITEYERRAGRYWSLECVQVRTERAGKGNTPTEVREAESRRLLDRISTDLELIALTRRGESWTSERLARYLGELAVGGRPGAAFLVGGAFGLADTALQRCQHRLRLSRLTLPHDLARLLLAEQIYRAGTILRGEPYHKVTNR